MPNGWVPGPTPDNIPATGRAGGRYVRGTTKEVLKLMVAGINTVNGYKRGRGVYAFADVGKPNRKSRRKQSWRQSA
jgi:hypothetical protein